MKIQYCKLLKATISAILVFILIDAIVEFIILKLTGITLLTYFEKMNHCQYGIQFYALNILIFSFEMFLVMFFYVVLRSIFKSKYKSITICISFFICFIGLFLLQLVNLGVYPAKAALIFGASTLIGFPAAVFAGAFMYERIITEASPSPF